MRPKYSKNLEHNVVGVRCHAKDNIKYMKNGKSSSHDESAENCKNENKLPMKNSDFNVSID